jgi:hypothetical protein
LEQLQVDINPSLLNALTEEDLGMWRMPEGSTFIDGLSLFLELECDCNFFAQS